MAYDTPLTPEQEQAFLQWQGKLPANLRGNEDYDISGAFAGGAQVQNGHLPDTYKKPNHMTFSEESQYSTPEQPGGRWVEDGKGGWVFWAGEGNMMNHPVSELADYFAAQEPGNPLVLPIRYNLENQR